jgi:hypothetical protein
VIDGSRQAVKRRKCLDILKNNEFLVIISQKASIYMKESCNEQECPFLSRSNSGLSEITTVQVSPPSSEKGNKKTGFMKMMGYIQRRK